MFLSFIVGNKYKLDIAMDKPASIKRRRGTRQFFLGSAWGEETIRH